MVGIPKYLSYYNYDKLVIKFLNYLNIKTIYFEVITDEIINLGNINTNKELCLPLKMYIGNIAYLQNKCNYIVTLKQQKKCINYIYLKDIINMFDTKIIYIDKEKEEIEEFIKLGKIFNKNYFEIMRAYTKAKIESDNYYGNKNRKNKAKLQNKAKKALIIGKLIKEEYIFKKIKDILKNNNIDIIYNDNFNLKNLTNINFVIYLKSCDNKIDEVISINNQVKNIPVISVDINDFKKEELLDFIKTFTHSI